MSTLTFVSNKFFFSIYHIHSLDHIFTYTSNWSSLQCPSGSSFSLSTIEPVETVEEALVDKGLPGAKAEVDILLEPPAGPGEATEG